MNHPQEEEEEEELVDENPHITFSIYRGRAILEEQLAVPTSGITVPDLEDKLNDAIKYSSGPSDGGLGIRRFNVKHFLSRLASSGLHPVILVSKVTIAPPALPSGSCYQVLSKIRFILDPEDYSFIAPPYYEGEPQGNYDDYEGEPQGIIDYDYEGEPQGIINYDYEGEPQGNYDDSEDIYLR